MRTELTAKLIGTIVPIVTPMADDFGLRLEMVPRHIDYLIDGGVRVVVPCGSTGEFPSLTIDEREAMIQATVEAVGGRIGVIAGTSHTRVGAVVRMSNFAASVGADGVLITPPYYFLPSEEEVFQFFAEIDRQIEIPFMFYNNPATTKFNASYELLDRLASLDNFGAVKENNSQPVRYYEELQLFKDRFPVIPAGEPPAIFNILSGAPGFLSVAANFNPRLIGEMLEASQNGRIEEAFNHFEILRRYRQLFEARNRQGYPMYVTYAKASVNLLGIEAGPPRLPLSPPSPDELDELRQILFKDMKLEPIR